MQGLKRKNKQEFSKIKNICASKNTIRRLKRQSTEWKKIFANDAINKGLILKICKVYTYPYQKAKNPIKKCKKPK